MNPNQFELDLAAMSLDEMLNFEDSSEEEEEEESQEAIEDGAELPEELMKNVVRLSCDSTVVGGSCHVYLLGTAHISQVEQSCEFIDVNVIGKEKKRTLDSLPHLPRIENDSCREVESIIRFLKPQVVFLELCSRRISVLSPPMAKEPTMVMSDMWKRKQNLLRSLLSSYFDKLASKLEVAPGSEFRVAYEEAKKYGGKVILGDRHIEITLARTWGRMSVWYKAKFALHLLTHWTLAPTPEELYKMMGEFDDKDVVTLAIEELSKKFPTLVETLIRERDQYMSSKLLELAKEHSSIVAVVGKGHLQGIKQNWEQPIEIQKLLEVPVQKSGVNKIVKSLGVAVAGVAIISGIYFSSKK